MRYLAGTGTGFWVAPVLAAIFVAYICVSGRLFGRASRSEPARVAPPGARKAA